MTREQAEVELQAIESALDTKIDDDNRERVLSLIEKDRLMFDEEAESFTMRLRKPIELDNGKTIEELTIKDPTAEQLQKADKNDGGFALTLRTIGFVSGQPIGVINRMKSRDLTAASAVLSFFG